MPSGESSALGICPRTMRTRPRPHSPNWRTSSLEYSPPLPIFQGYLLKSQDAAARFREPFYGHISKTERAGAEPTLLLRPLDLDAP
jgi:hypothetical protein